MSTKPWLTAIITGLLALLALVGCSDEPKTKLLYSYNFDDGKLGPEWKKEGGTWEVVNGRLHSPRAMNRDLVLTKPLPPQAVIELEMISHSPQVDVKFRAWGDVQSEMHDGAYHFILGGWNNSKSIIAPLGEHDPRSAAIMRKMEKDHWYKIKVVRCKGKIDLYVDGGKFLSYEDKEPLDTSVYKYFSFANWKTDCEFDNLRIYEIVD